MLSTEEKAILLKSLFDRVNMLVERSDEGIRQGCGTSEIDEAIDKANRLIHKIVEDFCN